MFLVPVSGALISQTVFAPFGWRVNLLVHEFTLEQPVLPFSSLLCIWECTGRPCVFKSGVPWGWRRWSPAGWPLRSALPYRYWWHMVCILSLLSKWFLNCFLHVQRLCGARRHRSLGLRWITQRRFVCARGYTVRDAGFAENNSFFEQGWIYLAKWCWNARPCRSVCILLMRAIVCFRLRKLKRRRFQYGKGVVKWEKR